MNAKQRQSLAKYAYDLSKIVLASFILDQTIFDREYAVLIFVPALAMAVLLLIVGYLLEKEE
ncbi:MAG: hypothetical protein ABIJ11_04965 [Elusimicrobiota bacterium]